MSLGSTVIPRTFGCVAMGSTVLFILRSRCDADVIYVGHDLNRCSGWWYVSSVNVEKFW